MPRGNWFRLPAAAGLILAAGVGLSACSGSSGGTTAASATHVPATASANTGQPSPSASATTDEDALCRPGEGKTVTKLADVQVPAVVAAAVVQPATTVGGTNVPTRSVPGFQLPAQTVDGGCQVTFDAPGGCLGAVQISSFTIPAETIPARTLPAVSLPDGRSLPAVTMPAITAPAVVVPGVRADQVCQFSTGHSLPSVVRPSIVRNSGARQSITQPAASQPGVQVGSSFLPYFFVPATYLPAVQVNSAITPSGYLAYRVLAGDSDVQVAAGKDGTSYVTPGDVLFATGKASLRPAATKALRAVATQIEAGPDDAKIIVEGHTDSRAGAAFNLDLSRRRAQTVAGWLQRHAGVASSRLTVTGLGETAPVASNATVAGRQRNRRVVITVEKG